MSGVGTFFAYARNLVSLFVFVPFNVLLRLERQANRYSTYKALSFVNVIAFLLLGFL